MTAPSAAPVTGGFGTRTRRLISPAAFSPPNATLHPYGDRTARTALNRRLQGRGVPAKACSRCLVIQSCTAFEAFRSASDGLRSYCRSCKGAEHAKKQAADADYRRRANDRTRAYYAENAEQRKAYSKLHKKTRRAANQAKHADRVQDPNATKRCTGRCGELLPETSFRLDRGQPDGLRTRCRDCATGAARLICWQTHGAPEGQVCYLCMALIESASDAQADHLLPQSTGGPDEPGNLRWTHAECNASRSARPLTPDEWRRIDFLNATTRGVMT